MISSLGLVDHSSPLNPIDFSLSLCDTIVLNVFHAAECMKVMVAFLGISSM